jgi:hypothetical protein
MNENAVAVMMRSLETLVDEMKYATPAELDAVRAHCEGEAHWTCGDPKGEIWKDMAKIFADRVIF